MVARLPRSLPVLLAVMLLVAACSPPARENSPSESTPAPASAAPTARLKYTTDIPQAIVSPTSVETRLGTLKFVDGVPDEATTQKVYDNLDFQRALQAFLVTMPAASLSAMRQGLQSVGVNNSTIVVFDDLMDSRTLFLTPNSESVYAFGWLDLKNGPLVVETPPNVLAFVDDFWFHYVTDMGNAGPDKGQGGKYLTVPPGYQGPLPTSGYFVAKSATFGNWLVARGFLVNKDPKPAADGIRSRMRIYPLSQAANPPATHFVNGSGKSFNTIHAMDNGFYEEVNQVVQEEPADAIDPETLGLLASIGIVKGKPFAPDARMQKILSEAAAVASATARATAYRSRMPEYRMYPTGSWGNVFPGGDHLFLLNGARALDFRSMFFFEATGITPAMSVKRVGVGSQYTGTTVDSRGRPFDGAKTYKLHLPPNIPAKDFWSVVVYDTQTRSMLQTDQQFPSTGSQKTGLVTNPDGSVDIYFGPTNPANVNAANWVQTVPRKGWFMALRLYGPLQSWFDQTWKPSEIEEIR